MFAMGMVTFFCLCANILATVAWFTSNRIASNDNDYFAVENDGDANIESVSLYKFKYKETVYGNGENAITVTDYLNPEFGEVKKYGFPASAIVQPGIVGQIIGYVILVVCNIIYFNNRKKLFVK